MTTLHAPPDRLISTEEAAAILDLKPGTLATWRVRRFGPSFVRLGKAVRYRESDVRAFVSAATIQTAGKDGRAA
jgi:predicted DNA-binding transcriptional regulator AlpA